MPAHIVASLLLAIVLALQPAVAAALDLQGHRGARGLAPENTLPAFARALALGVTTLELDTGVTRDGIVVIAHDPTLNPDLTRDASGQWLPGRGPAIRSLRYAELARYDVGRLRPGSEYAGRHPDQVAADGARIPQLVDLFALVRSSGNDEVRFNIETKIDPGSPETTLPPEEFARAVVDVVRRSGMAARSTIQSFDWRTLAVVQRIAPEIPTAYLSAQQRFLDNIQAGKSEGSPWTAGWRFAEHGSVARMVKAAGGSVWSPHFGDLDATKLREARELGLKVVVWTVNSPDQVRRMLDLGVDGIISDRPDLVRAAAASRGIRLPRPTPVAPS